MIELTEMFKVAWSSSFWTQESVRRVLDAIRNDLEESSLDWEPKDEEWGRVLVGQEVKALVCARVPVAVLIGTDWSQDLIVGLTRSGVAIIHTEDYEAVEYSVDRATLESIFERPLSENVDFSRCSINDIWWSTV